MFYFNLCSANRNEHALEKMKTTIQYGFQPSPCCCIQSFFIVSTLKVPSLNLWTRHFLIKRKHKHKPKGKKIYQNHKHTIFPLRDLFHVLFLCNCVWVVVANVIEVIFLLFLFSLVQFKIKKKSYSLNVTSYDVKLIDLQRFKP